MSPTLTEKQLEREIELVRPLMASQGKTDSILLCIWPYRHYTEKNKYVGVDEITQLGISSTLSMRRSNLPRELKKLLKKNLIYSEYRHTPNRPRKMKCYFLTEKGITVVKKLLDDLIQSNRTFVE